MELKRRNKEIVMYKNCSWFLEKKRYTVELQWLEHLWNHENKFETGVVRANEGW